MKNNYFYTTLQKEFSLLCEAASSSDAATVFRCRDACEKLHEGLCRHLFQAFVTPLGREDLYRISSAVLALFSPLAAALSCGERERERIGKSAGLFLSFRPEEGVLSLVRELDRFRKTEGNSSAARACGEGFFRLAEALVIASLKNV